MLNDYVNKLIYIRLDPDGDVVGKLLAIENSDSLVLIKVKRKIDLLPPEDQNFDPIIVIIMRYVISIESVVENIEENRETPKTNIAFYYE